jgi:hypothetical protein
MMLQSPVSELIRVSHAARLLGISEGMVRVLADTNRLPCLRVEAQRWFNTADVLKLRDARIAGGPR